MYRSQPELASFDVEIGRIIKQEELRQEQHLELIASENYASPRVLAAQGSVLNNKYAEGYPERRYYGGCEWVDKAEQLAIERAKKLFKADYVNVQPHSGSQANAAAYMATVQAGDTIMGMDLAAGGHLTHGSKVSFSGKMYNAVGYGLDPQSGLIDYDQVMQLAKQHRPKLIMAGFSAYSRKIDWQKFRQIADEVGAYLVVDIAHVAGLVAVGLYPSPLQIADITTSTTHKTLRGPRSGLIMAKQNPELTKRIDSAVFPGLQGGPLCHVIAAKAVAFLEALQPDFKLYQQWVLDNAAIMAEVMVAHGLKIVSGGTDNHMFLVDLSNQHLTGKEATELLASAKIVVNKNTIPNDPLPPTITSGIRIGSPAMTTRGMHTDEAKLVAESICKILLASDKAAAIKEVTTTIDELCKAFPVYDTYHH